MKYETITFNYTDYQTWNKMARYELMKGRVVFLRPGPTEIHQKVLYNLHNIIQQLLISRGLNYTLFKAPFEIILPGENETKANAGTIVQPDLAIFSDRSQTSRTCLGPPDFIAEITSPTTGKNDRGPKRDLYRDFNIPEYWILNPYKKNIQKLNFERETQKRYSANQKIPLNLVETKIPLGEIFA